MSRPLWFTTTAGVFAEYTEVEHDALMDSLLGPGVIPAITGTYSGRLAVTAAAPNVNVAAGAAMVDKKLCAFESGVALAVPTATAGTTGHRIVVRKDASAKTAVLAIKSAADGTATPPTASQTPGGLYEESLATLTRTTGGTITVTDVRSWARARGQLGSRRQGGSATDWSTTGTTNYEPANELRQYGSIAFNTGVSGNSYVVTFPTAYPAGTVPLVFVTVHSNSVGMDITYLVSGISATQATLQLGAAGQGPWSGRAMWFAVGPTP